MFKSIIIKEKKELKSEQIPVVFIAHEDSPEGIKRTRKLFSTLNRRAKLVAENAQIALDEDDVVAIATRELMVSCPLFIGKRLINVKSKPIPVANLDAFTSLVTLYQCNTLLVKEKLQLKGNAFTQYLFYRPADSIVEEVVSYVLNYWNLFMSEIEDVKNYLSTDITPAQPYRNENGGNILFRPIVLTEYVKASIRIANKYGGDYQTAFNTLGKIKMQLSDNPWAGVLWDGKRMIAKADKKLIMLLILKMCGNDFLEQKENGILVEKFISALNYNGDISEIERLLDSLVQ